VTNKLFYGDNLDVLAAQDRWFPQRNA